MKIKVFDTEEGFKPVTFTITCETREELLGFFHRFNVDSKEVEKVAKNTPKKMRLEKTEDYRLPSNVFRAIKEALERRNLYVNIFF